MEAKNKGPSNVTRDELALIQRLRKHPLILERVEHILALATDEGSGKTADQIEEMLVQEMRQLGNATMHEWASLVEAKTGEDIQKKTPGVLKRKKKR
jgi:hypothetical protein